MKEFHRHLDDELNELRDQVLLLGCEAERAVERAMFALRERDNDVANEVLQHDDDIDRLEVQVDRLCIDVIALHQPAARDLRFVIAAVKMAPILERIADHACNIARAVVDLNLEPESKRNAELENMAEHAVEMLHGARAAFKTKEGTAARGVIARDEEINLLYNNLFRNLIELMASEPRSATRGARLLFIAKHLERIGDYAKDICELTVYMM